MTLFNSHLIEVSMTTMLSGAVEQIPSLFFFLLIRLVYATVIKYFGRLQIFISIEKLLYSVHLQNLLSTSLSCNNTWYKSLYPVSFSILCRKNPLPFTLRVKKPCREHL